MNDLVSIIMPSYNTAEFISQSIESVLNQTHANWELIIVDDCSEDETEKVVLKFGDKRIKFIKNEKNSGAAITRNKALREAKGKWIAFLDSDDLWTPDKLEKQINFMIVNDYHFSYTEYEEIDKNGGSLGIRVTGPKCITKFGMYNYCWPGCLTVMYDRETVGNLQIGNIKKNNDYAMWLIVCKKCKCYLLKDILAKYRRHSGSISNVGFNKLIKWHYKLFREIDNENALFATFNTFRNLFFGVFKKLFYKKRINNIND